MEPSDGFVYSPLQPDEFRLMKILPTWDFTAIHCELEQISLKNCPGYEALSYVWGPDEIYKSITLNGKQFPVQRNLWFALDQLSRRHIMNPKLSFADGLVSKAKFTRAPQYVWIDAICINQDDVVERSRQVQNMSRIFESAMRVVIWLGEGNSQ